MKKIKGGVTAPKGFAAMGLKAGIKKDKKDMAMIYSSIPCVAAGTFTTNQVKAAPVIWDRDTIYTSDYVHAVVCNSGVANAASNGQNNKRNPVTCTNIRRKFRWWSFGSRSHYDNRYNSKGNSF